MHEGSSSQNSHVPSIDDNEIYFSGVGGESKKGNVYGLGTLSKKFHSYVGAHSSTSQAPVVHQIEEMRETIQKLNAELMAKNAKEKTLEEKVEHLLKNHAEQSERMHEQNERIRQQDEQMKLILQHTHLKNVVPGPSDPTTIRDDRVDHIADSRPIDH